MFLLIECLPKFMANEKRANILVPIDVNEFSEKGLKEAIKYAKYLDADITGVNVVEVRSTLVSTVINYKKYVTEKSQKFLDSVGKKCEKEGIKFHSKILYGKPSTEITKFSKKNKFDLIIIGARGLTGLKSALMGSTSNAIVQKSNTSVLVVK